jgi:hypothetical protein
MCKIYAACLSAILLLCLTQQPRAQLTITDAGGGFGGAAAYAGPGDAVSGAAAWWGLRCFNTAYTGNVADVYAPSDASHTLITCSAGGVLNETLQALSTTCATSCTVKTLYDQSGASACSGACDMSQATEANRPTLVLNCLGSKPCIAFSGSAQFLSAPGAASAVNQPFTYSCVINRTGDTANAQSCIGGNDFAFTVGFGGANTLRIFAGNVVTAAANDNAWHAVQYTVNGASSNIYVDGGGNTVDAGTQNHGTSSINMGTITTGGSGIFTGRLAEAGRYNSAFAADANASSLNSNERAYWGF